MNRNIRIAKQLLKLAKGLLEDTNITVTNDGKSDYSMYYDEPSNNKNDEEQTASGGEFKSKAEYVAFMKDMLSNGDSYVRSRLGGAAAGLEKARFDKSLGVSANWGGIAFDVNDRWMPNSESSNIVSFYVLYVPPVGNTEDGWFAGCSDSSGWEIESSGPFDSINEAGKNLVRMLKECL